MENLKLWNEILQKEYEKTASLAIKARYTLILRKAWREAAENALVLYNKARDSAKLG